MVNRKLIREGQEYLSSSKKKNKSFWSPKYLIIFIFTYALCCIGGTYAYFALSAEDNSTIVGIAGVADIDLDVERIIPNNTGVMVPQLESALGTAISSQYNCIDGNNNTVCQVYKATVTNTGTSNVRLNGTMSFTGINNLPNLKWKRITNATTIGEYSSNIATTSDVAFETDKLFAPTESITYYFVVWIDETGQAQTDNGTFRVTVKFNSTGDGLTSTITDGEGGQGSQPTQLNAYATDIMVPLAQSDASLNFTQTSVASNTNGVYIRSGTENNEVPIYYYRGNVNNNLIFAETCWKVVRTTETGGLKLLYNGVPSNGQCNNTGTASQIGTKEFNTNYNSPAYVGYMYSTVYPRSRSSKSVMADNAYYYGNSVTYSNGTYTLVNTISGTWDNLYNDGLKNNHYTCFSTTGATCTGEVNYVFFTDINNAYYITLTNGKDVEDALFEMFGSDEANQDDYNTISSTIKGNSTTAGTIDHWYYTNIEQKGYKDYIEDTVWCNDRTIYNKAGWEPNGGSTTTRMTFGGRGRLDITKQPSLTCSRNVDKFTVSSAIGNGSLDYPVGLLTADEIMLAGADTQFNPNNSYYLYTGQNYWAGSPSNFSDTFAYEFLVTTAGDLSLNEVRTTNGVRPSVSLKPGFQLTGNGDGSVTNPYVVE